jgi:phenylpropionate dioxygenase-like ring-hydroxylating dioxygenase large terminal subunit
MIARDGRATAYHALVAESPTQFRIRNSLYIDPALFEEEMRAIFERTWVYLAHESEVAHPGDYRTSAIGRKPVIVSRTEDGQIAVLLNVCRHRGAAVCREDRGSSQSFRCPYHGWVYANDGALIGVSHRDGYPDGFADTLPDLGLYRVPRVATYRGLIFASLKPDIESLEEYLGAVAKYIDLWADQSPVGKVRLALPHLTSFPANWKFQFENGVDGYHVRFVHQSAMGTFEHFGVATPLRQDVYRREPGCTRGFDRGHGILERPGIRAGFTPEQMEYYRGRLVEAFGPERTDEILVTRHINVFPNLVLMDANIRVVQPVAVNETVVYSWYAGLEGIPDEMNSVRLKDLQTRLGTTGLVNPDDIEIFVANQSGVQAAPQGWSILDRGIDREIVKADGEREGRASDETPQRALYRVWAQHLRAAAT